MTRKQAVHRAIQILEGKNECKNIVLKLQEIEEELPLSTWTQSSIIDSIEDYAYNHNNTLPSITEFTSINHLPSNTVIKAKFNISSMQYFLDKYFPHLKKCDKNYSPYKQKTKEYFINIFIENYRRIQSERNIKYVTSKIFDKYKKSNTPHSSTIIKKCECSSYKDLLILSGIRNADKSITSSINVTFNDKEDVDELLNIITQTKNRKK